MPESVSKSDRIRNQIDEEALDIFWNFINKRQSVWYRRTIDENEPPWTQDEILQKYRFTNVYRQLDPGTQYVIQNILEKDGSREDKVFNVMVYRLIGRLETHEDLGFQHLESFNPENLEKALKHRRDVKDETVFTGAYLVAGYSQMGSSDKVENVAHLFGEVASEMDFFDKLVNASSAKEAYKLIASQPGFGNFLSYQVLVDLMYPVDYYEGESILPFSPNEWSSPGPGAQKGIEKLTEDNSKLDKLELMSWLHQNQQTEFNRLNIEFDYLKDEDDRVVELSLADIQNCLCEFYKYHKILNSEGRARRRFRNSSCRSNKDLRSIYESSPGFSLEKT